MDALRPRSPNQLFLLPPSLLDWLPQDHIVHVLSEVVDQLDISPIAADLPQFSPSVDPRVMVKLLFYAYVSGVCSSRRIAQRCIEDVGFRVLTWNAAPAFRLISAFRRQYRPALQPLFLQIVRCCRQLGLNRVGDIALNGTAGTAKASARRSGRSVWSESAYSRFVADVDAFFAKADETDAAEDRQFGVATHGDGLPVALSRDDSRQGAIREALAYLSTEGGAHEVDSPAARAKSRKWSASSPKPSAEPAAPEQPEGAEPAALAPEAAGTPGPNVRNPIQGPKTSGVAIPMSEIAHLLEEALDPIEAVAYGVGASEDSGARSEPPVVELHLQGEASSALTSVTPRLEVPGTPSRPFDLSPVTGGLRTDGVQTPLGRILPALGLQVNRRRNIRMRMPNHYPAKLQLQDAELVDLSVSGALVEHVGTIRPGQLYTLCFELEGHQVQTQARAVRGQVNRLAPPEHGERRIVYRTALEFVRIDNGGSERIVAHIERMQEGATIGA
jgi:transposase